MGGWMDGRESRVKDCLQQPKIIVVEVPHQLHGNVNHKTLKLANFKNKENFLIWLKSG
jgi:hypothetical protein